MKQKDIQKDSDFDSYQEAYHEIDHAFPKFWKWVGVGSLILLFLFALPYLLGHTAKTIREYKGLREAVKGLQT